MCRIIEGGWIRLLLGLLLGLLGSSPGAVARTDGALVEVRVDSDPPGRVSVCVFLLMESVVEEVRDADIVIAGFSPVS